MASDQNDTARPAPKGEGRVLGARGTARLAAVQALYQMDLAQTDAGVVVAQFIKHRFGDEAEHYDQADEAFFKDLVLGVVRDQLTIDPLIAGHLARGWRLERIDSILRAILRGAAYELKVRRDVPVKVIINEYLDIAHAFFGGDEPGVVNGVLDAVAREVRPGDFKSKGHG